MSNLREITDAIFKYRSNWVKISDEDKVKNAFIVNRFLSKTYPKKAMSLNLKSQDPVSSINIWYHFMGGERYPSDFWSKSPKLKNKVVEKDKRLLIEKLELNKKEDLEYLIEHHPDLIKEELKWLKKNLKK